MSNEMAVELFQAREARALDFPAPGLTDRFTAWADAFELWLQSRRSVNTQRAYRKSWEMLLAYTDKQPWDISKVDVAGWVSQLKAAGASDCTVGQRVAAISSFYNFCRDEYTVIRPDGREQSLHDHNPAAAKSLRPKVEPYGKATYLSADEARALLRAISRNTVQGLRDYALYLTYLATGRRNSEVRRLRWGDFEKAGGRVWYRWSGKGKKDRRNELPLRVFEAIQEYLRAAGRLDGIQDGDWIFTALDGERAARLPNVSDDFDPFGQPLSMRSVNDLLKKYCRRAGLDGKKVHVHTLRHTAAMLRKEAGDDVEKISQFLEHSSLAVTQIYVHRVEGKKDESWSKVETLLGI